MIKFQADALLNRMENLIHLREKIDDERLMLVDFDDLVNDYNRCKSSIENFVGLSGVCHKYAGHFFNPDTAQKKSIAIFKDYLREEELQYFDELERVYLHLKTGSDSDKLN